MTSADIERLIAELPEMDFYAPFREHRRTWSAGADVAIGVTMNQNSPHFAAFSASGQMTEYDASKGVPGTAILILHPAEAKAVRSRQQTRSSGPVIQDEDDGEAGGVVIVRDKSGRIIREEPVQVFPALLADCPECIEDPGGGGDGSGGPLHRTRLDQFIIYYQDGVGTAEIEYTISDNSHQKTVRFTGIRKDQVYTAAKPLWDDVLTFNASDNVSVVETDLFSDDFWGRGTVRSFENGVWKATWGLCELVGDPNTNVHPECLHPPYITMTTEFRVAWY